MQRFDNRNPMRLTGRSGTPVKVAIPIVVASLAAVIAWHMRPTEPVYRGKPLSTWLQTYATPGGTEAFADEAVRQAGTNAIPTLLRLLRFDDSALRIKFMDLVRQQHIVTIEFTTAATKNWAGVRGFGVLGTNARSATSALIEIANRNISPSSRYYSIDALGLIGPPAKEAVPSLMRWATDTNVHVLCSAMRALGEIRQEPGLVLPVLTSALHSAVPVVRMNAVSALGDFGPVARPAVPALVEMFSDSVPDVRRSAANALQAIDPEAAAKTSVN
jgi:HEAT repeat protein